MHVQADYKIHAYNIIYMTRSDKTGLIAQISQIYFLTLCYSMHHIAPVCKVFSIILHSIRLLFAKNKIARFL